MCLFLEREGLREERLGVKLELLKATAVGCRVDTEYLGLELKLKPEEIF